MRCNGRGYDLAKGIRDRGQQIAGLDLLADGHPDPHIAAALGGDITNFVHPAVAAALTERFKR